MAKGVRPMVGPSKILTVSYGTFSCTLEGFDDPFNTMKAIAEYFRDLAADDRYFGAEPPVPDAAMLHRIAEREVQRRVEARVQEGGVLLRAAEPAVEPAPAAAVPATPAPVAAPGPRLHPTAPSIEESVAAKLARIRAAVDRARVAPPVVADIEDAVEVPAPAIIAAPLAKPSVAEAPRAAAPAAAAIDADTASPAPAAAEPAHPAPQPEAARAPAVADDMPVAEAAPEIAAVPVWGEAEEAPHAEAGPTAGPLAGFDTDAEAAELVTPPAPAAEAAPADAGDGDLDALIGRIAAIPGPDAAQAPATEPEAEADAAKAAPPEPVAEALSADAEDGTPVAAPANAPAPVSAAEATPETDDPETADAQPEAPAPVVPVRARVIKVRRIEPAAPPATLLSPEEEDELARELAAVEREMASPAPSRVAAPGPDLAAPPAAAADAVPPRADAGATPAAAEDAAVTRLIAQTNTAMDGAENRRRAATIAHLKAAVAATVADRAAGAAPADAARGREDAYREDLAEAVRPRRPEAVPGTGRRRPEAAPRIAPLVLVSEQRVDRPAGPPADAQPVRPRRVTAGSLALTQALDADADEAAQDGDGDAAGANIFVAAGRFPEVVERLGAVHLTETIEAAAAYITVVEGRETFTRPQLVRLAGTVSGAAVGREDGLRAFGLLLREGRIEKARRGQFMLPAGNRMLAEMRALAD